jgi:uncharacterized C2H2 Zn-finger protein
MMAHKSSIKSETSQQHNSEIYCKLCSTYFPESAFIRHIKIAHESASQQQKSDPDINDTDFHCRVCDMTYRSREYYLQHLKTTHQIKISANKKKVTFKIEGKEDNRASCVKRDFLIRMIMLDL